MVCAAHKAAPSVSRIPIARLLIPSRGIFIQYFTSHHGRARPPIISLDKYMPVRVYKKCGIGLRSHCRAEPARDIEPPGLLPTVGGRDRAAASYAAAGRLQAPASAARRRFRGI